MPQNGETAISRSGRPMVYTPAGWSYADGQGKKGTSAADTAYERKLGTSAADETIAVRARAANAPSQVVEAAQLLTELPQRRTGPGASIGMAVMPFLGDKENTKFQRRLDAFASEGVLADAAALKPISNSDISFLQTLQAGANQTPEANREFLIGSQWANQLAIANQAARDRWSSRYGSPNARNERGQDFSTFWMQEYPKRFPRPNFGKVAQGKGYDFRQQRQAPAKRPTQPTQGGNDMSRMTDAQLRALIERGQ